MGGKKEVAGSDVGGYGNDRGVGESDDINSGGGRVTVAVLLFCGCCLWW